MTWTELVAKLPHMTEAELKAEIAKEAQRGDPRASHLTRMHMRLCKLRAARERRELLGKRNLD
jgi:hypothetical protein